MLDYFGLNVDESGVCVIVVYSRNNARPSVPLGRGSGADTKSTFTDR